MGITALYCRLDSQLIKKAREDDSFVTALIDEEADEKYGYQTISIDKTWDAICYLLSSARRCLKSINFDYQNPPNVFSHALFGKTLLNEKADYGYGPARLNNVEVVLLISEELEKISESDFKSFYKPKDMRKMDVYLYEVWIRDREAALNEYILPHFLELRNFYNISSKERQAVITVFS